MITALIITWLFWGTLITLEIYWKRVWVMWLVVPLALSGLWFLLSRVSEAAALYSSLLIHLGLAAFILVRLLNDRRPNEWRRD